MKKKRWGNECHNKSKFKVCSRIPKKAAENRQYTEATTGQVVSKHTMCHGLTKGLTRNKTKHHGVATYEAAKRTITTRIRELGGRSKTATDG